jgi:5'-methylthioadenosine phosphorylase
VSGQASIGLIGGSGLYDLAGVEEAREVRLQTPFGEPSDAFVLGRLAGRAVAFLARHGRGHRFSPSEINYRANIHGFKTLGVRRIFSASAVGSMREEIAPLDVVIPDQFIDRTHGRAGTFFEGGIVAHVSLADPICAETAAALAAAARSLPGRVHAGGTYLCIEGPAFSTRAESRLFRSWGAAVIGMTNMQEARLAREAELCYATLALVTDYDCWREGEAVSVEEIVRNLRQNATHAIEILRGAVASVPDERSCGCGAALADAILTRAEDVPAAARRRLAALLPPRFTRQGGAT